ncbi:MAG TPA: cyclase family protein [Cryomorphaceae bacterium]|nr:cyclase family protein [Cryomorphaceae bacterium]
MTIELKQNGELFAADLSKPLDISIPLSPGGPRAWYMDPMRIEPVMTERFNGSVEDGGDVNFRNIWFNPHGHGTHTETVGHIDREIVSINKTLQSYFFLCRLITIAPEIHQGADKSYIKKGDRVITANQIEEKVKPGAPEALVVRTLPNTSEKCHRNYSNTNSTFFEPEALSYIRRCGVKHFLTDLPSVDREEDGGQLLAHRAFWCGDRPDDRECTISEMIYAPDKIADGLYLLNLQIAAFENDASPSKPVLYSLTKT